MGRLSDGIGGVEAQLVEVDMLAARTEENARLASMLIEAEEQEARFGFQHSRPTLHNHG